LKRRRHTPEQIVRKLREADRILAEGVEARRSRRRWRSPRRPTIVGALVRGALCDQAVERAVGLRESFHVATFERRAGGIQSSPYRIEHLVGQARHRLCNGEHLKRAPNVVETGDLCRAEATMKLPWYGWCSTSPSLTRRVTASRTGVRLSSTR
jgi:hypothetical protein